MVYSDVTTSTSPLSDFSELVEQMETQGQFILRVDELYLCSPLVPLCGTNVRYKHRYPWFKMLLICTMNILSKHL